MDFLELGYFGLFLICFLSATLLPLASEGVLLLFLLGGFDPWLCLLVATIGNTLGGTTNYAIGLLGNPERLKKRLGKPERFIKMASATKRYGYWLGLVSWVPIIGDPLVVVLGYFRVPFFPLLLLMTLAKFLRYWIIIFVWNG